MPHWTDIQGLCALLEERGEEIAALQQSVTELRQELSSHSTRLAALESPGPPPVLPGHNH